MQGSGIFSRFSLVFCLGKSILYKVNVMLQFSGALTLRQQLDWKKNRTKSSKNCLMFFVTEYLKKQLLIFSETWSSSFCIVCNCFDDFRINLPKNIGRFHRKQNTIFPKRRWVRSKNVFLSAALLYSLVVTKKNVLGTSSNLCTWNNTCFLFKCRVTFRLRLFSKATFGTFALDILRLRCLGISKTYKKSF